MFPMHFMFLLSMKPGPGCDSQTEPRQYVQIPCLCILLYMTLMLFSWVLQQEKGKWKRDNSPAHMECVVRNSEELQIQTLDSEF